MSSGTNSPTLVTPEFWRKCSSCKKPIGYTAIHYVCSVSTCTRKRTGYVFCTVHCWERHLPGARHRDAAAIEAKSPTFEAWKKEVEESTDTAQAPGASAQSSPSGSQPETRDPKRVIVRSPSGVSNSNNPGVSAGGLNPPPPAEVLIVVSKLKNYIRARSEMNTSDAVMDTLSQHLRRICDRAIENARADGRKTVMERDFEGLI